MNFFIKDMYFVDARTLVVIPSLGQKAETMTFEKVRIVSTVLKSGVDGVYEIRMKFSSDTGKPNGAGAQGVH